MRNVSLLYGTCNPHRTRDGMSIVELFRRVFSTQETTGFFPTFSATQKVLELVIQGDFNRGNNGRGTYGYNGLLGVQVITVEERNLPDASEYIPLLCPL